MEKNKNTSEDMRPAEEPKQSAFWQAMEVIGVAKPEPGGLRIGMRNFKTSLAVFLTTLLYWLIGRSNTSLFLALIAAIVSMQDTTKSSLRFGLQRLLGTTIGGLLGIAFVAIFALVPLHTNKLVFAGCLAIGSMAAIALCAWLQLKQALIMALVVLLAILIGEGQAAQTFSYAFNRMLDTAIGVVISIAINLTIRPPKWE